ncbi:hypothetical protein [Rathayibacter toxicus]|uniref:Uncharacterized protein n=1 Tax=Rathayibacter toxicus TaxID=145458 RepID=A0A2S5Y9G4_9MICO|nr:hypothetical protein [Rathayibacter toxicus]ALS56754.1 hypothetical protein APU90_02315 [Rathayibacter toxicus]PPG23387.1 hypothetical protein C5D15_03960 [Rathayibacter toxicus]PPG47972.1 hypothetical protein C5D16_03960 [Rathayibacter toxicus]PPH25120.1 hypothetical protein C5D17_03965 [Rathayibacter toxicus]PPH59047.1 hypothetical protein C5D30_03980 [Rathayibacter toxicus]
MTENPAAASDAGHRDRSGRYLLRSVLVTVVVGLLLAWDVWEAIGNFLGLRAFAAGFGADLNGFGWTVLVLGMVLPMLCFVVALLLGRRRGFWVRTGILLAALCLSAALSCDLQLTVVPISLMTPL